jgi:hypothetical protein
MRSCTSSARRKAVTSCEGCRDKDVHIDAFRNLLIKSEATVAALKAKLARYEGPLSEQMKTKLVESVPQTGLTAMMSRYGWDVVDAAIRKVRGEP